MAGWEAILWTSDDLSREENSPVKDHVVQHYLDEEGAFEGPVFVLEDEHGNILDSLKPEDTGEFYRTFYPRTKEKST